MNSITLKFKDKKIQAKYEEIQYKSRIFFILMTLLVWCF